MNRTTKTVTELEYDEEGRVTRETTTTTETETPSISQPFVGGWGPAPQKPSWWWNSPIVSHTTTFNKAKSPIVDGYL